MLPAARVQATLDRERRDAMHHRPGAHQGWIERGRASWGTAPRTAGRAIVWASIAVWFVVTAAVFIQALQGRALFPL